MDKLIKSLSSDRVFATVEEVEMFAKERHAAKQSGGFERAGRDYHAYYWKLLLLLSLFYALPASQFLIWQYRQGSTEGFDQPGQECYFNFKCARQALGFYNFNNIVSNGMYVVVGCAFMLGVYLDRRGWQCGVGLDCDASLYYALGIAISCEGVFSAIYHICPSALNFQFDTTFMVVSGGLFLMSVYAKRHHYIVPSAITAYGWMFVFIGLNMLSLSEWLPTALFWIACSLVVVFLNLRGSFVVYQPMSYKSLPAKLRDFYRRIRSCQGPRRRKRFAFFVVCNLLILALSLAPLTYSQTKGVDPDSRSFPVFILGILVVSWIIYFFWYLFMKTVNTRRNPDEAVHLASIMFISLTVVFWILGVYFFKIPISNKFLSWEESKTLNADCVLFDYFDTHDIWHFTSALALGGQLMSIYTVDRQLRYTQRNQIVVF